MLTWPILRKPLCDQAVLRGQWNTLRRLFAFGMKKFRDSRVPDLNMRPLSSSHAKHFYPSLAFSDSFIFLFFKIPLDFSFFLYSSCLVCYKGRWNHAKRRVWPAWIRHTALHIKLHFTLLMDGHRRIINASWQLVRRTRQYYWKTTTMPESQAARYCWPG